MSSVLALVPLALSRIGDPRGDDAKGAALRVGRQLVDASIERIRCAPRDADAG